MKREFVCELERRISQCQPFIQVVLGPRQVGKTTGVLSIQLKPISYASADSPVPLDGEWIRTEWLKARLKGGIFVLDEVQKVQGWSEAVKILFDEERRRPHPLSIVLLGSASWNVQRGLGESLAGRYEILPVYHWDYLECKEAFGWDFETYLTFGGYPAPATLINEPERWQKFIRDSIIEPVISRDIYSLRAVSKPALFRQTLHLALNYPAHELSYNKMLGQLQESGNASTIKGYLELLEAAFLVKQVYKYSPRRITLRTSSPKLLPLCPALIHAAGSLQKMKNDPEWRGHIFECVIGSMLSRLFSELFYWRDGNREVDFVVELDEQIVGIEVKSGRKKTVTGREAFAKNFPGARTLVIDFELGEMLLRSHQPRKLLLEWLRS